MAYVLILDDDYALARRWRNHLRARGHEVVIAFTSPEAIAHVEHSEPDLFLVDLILRIEGVKPDDTGQRLLTYLGRRFDTGYVAQRAIGMSALHSPALEIDFRGIFEAYGITHFLAKPFDPGEMCEMVDQLCAALPAGTHMQRPLGA